MIVFIFDQRRRFILRLNININTLSSQIILSCIRLTYPNYLKIQGSVCREVAKFEGVNCSCINDIPTIHGGLHSPIHRLVRPISIGVLHPTFCILCGLMWTPLCQQQTGTLEEINANLCTSSQLSSELRLYDIYANL